MRLSQSKSGCIYKIIEIGVIKIRTFATKMSKSTPYGIMANLAPNQ